MARKWCLQGRRPFLEQLAEERRIGVLGMISDRSKTVRRVNRTTAELPRFEWGSSGGLNAPNDTNEHCKYDRYSDDGNRKGARGCSLRG